jgi:hypothetical protein
VHAASLYRRVSDFSHGGRNDVTNQVLAPTRLLYLLGKEASACSLHQSKQSLLDHFRKAVLSNAKSWGTLGLEICSTFDQIQSSIANQNFDCTAVEHLMDLLTECRNLAGEPTPAPDEKEARLFDETSQASKHQKPYTILVIDDHYEDWKPFFETICEQVGAVLKNRVYVMNCDPSKAMQTVPGCDIVLLDIFLPKSQNGLFILEAIRRHYVNVPVILWTISRESELPARARLAHGFLFKKSLTVSEIIRALARHLREGRARRLYPLPGHFFDQSILDEDKRKCALRFTEYCSKQLDSFHALDDQQFRYFTDHGGRHLFKLLEYLGEVLRPLVDDSGIFSSDPDRRQEEILSLYLAVFLHEFGMFRLPGNEEPDWDHLMEPTASESRKERLSQELALVRAFHAIRGMVMLAKEPNSDTKPGHWPDEEGFHQAQKRLWDCDDGNYLQSAVALITGHHSRFLPLDTLKGEWNHHFQDAYEEKAAKVLKTASASDFLRNRFYSPAAVEKALFGLLTNISSERLALIRQHCAIFRFVDAIDVDHTRNPARFLCAVEKINKFDRRETLKRQVVRKVYIEGGVVQMETNVKPPDVKLVQKILEKEFKNLPAELAQWINEPWGERARDNLKCCEAFQGRIDNWLAAFWDNPIECNEDFLDIPPFPPNRALLPRLPAALDIPVPRYRAGAS